MNCVEADVCMYDVYLLCVKVLPEISRATFHALKNYVKLLSLALFYV